jgi:phage shock protein PspC (stress-responsive transcriptional regulator)
MQKVISINLNGNAYQLDESGYETLRQYLALAEQQLEANPDRGEIMADLEQAIADKCQKYLGPNKNVVASGEIDRIVAEMGPVEAAAGEHTESGAGAAAGGSKTGQTQDAPPRRLYRIPSGAMIAGVCTGLAAYFHIDAAIVRIAFVAAALLTKGAAIIAYVVMMFVVPEAGTPEEAAVAGGAPFNAKEVIDRVGKRSAETTRELRRQWRRQQRAWRRHGWPPGAPLVSGPQPAALVMLPVFGLVHVALFLIMLAMLISLVNTGAILRWHLPPGVPVWAAALTLLIAYQIMVAPLRAVRHWATYSAGGVEPASFAFWNAVVWLIGLAFAIWLASNHTPEIREFLQRMPELFREFIWAMRDLFSRQR